MPAKSQSPEQTEDLERVTVATTDPVTEAKARAAEAAGRLIEADKRLVAARATLDDARLRVENLGRMLDDLRAEAAELTRDARLDEAQKRAPQIASTRDSLAQAEEIARVTGESVEGLELAVIRAEAEAERAHASAHDAIATAMRPELIDSIEGPFFRAWRHDLVGGCRQNFDDWLYALLRDAGVHGGDNHALPCDLDIPENAPRTESVGTLRRLELRRQLGLY
jgi:hypothetical protein